MWLLVVFYVSTGIPAGTPPTVFLDAFPTKGRDECRALKQTAEQMLSQDPAIGIKHQVICKKFNVS